MLSRFDLPGNLEDGASSGNEEPSRSHLISHCRALKRLKQSRLMKVGRKEISVQGGQIDRDLTNPLSAVNQ